MAKQAVRAGNKPPRQQRPGQSPEQSEEQQEIEEELEFAGQKFTKKQVEELISKRREYDRAASMRMEEAAKERKAAAAEVAQLRNLAAQLQQNPWAIHEHMGLNPDELAEKRLAASIQRSQMTPEQIELEKSRAELQALRQEQENYKQEKQKQAHQQRVQYWQDYFDKAIGSALQSKSIPRTAHSAQRVRQAFEDLIEAGHQIDDTTAAMAVDMARERATSESLGLFTDMADANPKMLVEMLGGLDGKIIKAIQREAVARHNGMVQPKPKQAAPAPAPKPKGPLTLEEVRAQLRIS